jgi:hypothetical protein
MGKWLILVGIITVIVGLLIEFAPNLFKWFGNLPGDINIRKENTRIFFPVTSLILVSVILTIIINLIRYFRNL